MHALTIRSRSIAVLAFSFIFYWCASRQLVYAGNLPGKIFNRSLPVVEDFEAGSKSGYAAGDVVLSSGSWHFDDALIGSLANDRKNGAKSARIRNNGRIGMNTDKADGASTITISYAAFGSDGNSTWELQISTDHGNTYHKVGQHITTSSPDLQLATFDVHVRGAIRIAIIKTDGSANRVNIDDIQMHPYAAATSSRGGGGGGGGGSTEHVAGKDDDNMLLGNPSGATGDVDNFDNYLMIKKYYALSYNRDKGEANWVSWHVQASDLDTLGRSNDFRPDSTLPANWHHVSQASYSGSGFDRGHLCPSGDRTATTEANSTTFLMTNMMPQAPRNNRQTWANLENYTRTLVHDGREVYVIAGSFGKGGSGAKGPADAIDNGQVLVPSKTWKVIVVLPEGVHDLGRIAGSTRVIAVIIPNDNNISTDWRQYRTSVRDIEQATGYNLLSNVPDAIQQVIETRVDNE